MLRSPNPKQETSVADHNLFLRLMFLCAKGTFVLIHQTRDNIYHTKEDNMLNGSRDWYYLNDFSHIIDSLKYIIFINYLEPLISTSQYTGAQLPVDTYYLQSATCRHMLLAVSSLQT